MASVFFNSFYLPIRNFAVDCYKIYARTDDIARLARQSTGFAIPTPEGKDRDVRIISVQLRTMGFLFMLQGALLINPMIGRHGINDMVSALFRLTFAGAIALIGHDLAALGTSIKESLEIPTEQASIVDLFKAGIRTGWYAFRAQETLSDKLKFARNVIAGSRDRATVENGALTASIKEVLRHTWLLKDIYDNHTAAINAWFSPPRR